MPIPLSISISSNITAQRRSKALSSLTPDATLILLARHGETDWNLEHRLQVGGYSRGFIWLQVGANSLATSYLRNPFHAKAMPFESDVV